MQFRKGWAAFIALVVLLLLSSSIALAGDGRPIIGCFNPGNAGLLVLNRTHRKTDTDPNTLGLGLRVVETLLRLEPEIQYQRRRGNGYYAARLQMSALEPPDFFQI